MKTTSGANLDITKSVAVRRGALCVELSDNGLTTNSLSDSAFISIKEWPTMIKDIKEMIQTFENQQFKEVR